MQPAFEGREAIHVTDASRTPARKGYRDLGIAEAARPIVNILKRRRAHTKAHICRLKLLTSLFRSPRLHNAIRDEWRYSHYHECGFQAELKSSVHGDGETSTRAHPVP